MVESEIIRCAFCHYHGIEAKPGKTVCPECGASFEIDDGVNAFLSTPIIQDCQLKV